ncbi:MAG: hypothetical protein LBF85_06395 [Tannerella sp.]|jgi:hypothetical protein|nr:hypothetical protein [Tannerella sp.]
MKIVVKILLVGAVLLLTYMCFRSIMGNVEFDSEREIRETAIQANLIDIRKAQIEYKNVYGVHAANFEELGTFLKEKKLPFLIKEGTLTDEQLEKGMTEKEAVKRGLIRRDTIWVLAKDTLFGANYNVDSMAIVPVKTVNARFQMDTATLPSSSGYTVHVFECGVKYDVYLGDLDRQLLINLKDEMQKMGKYDGLRVGSIKEINNNAGNWE